jgi:hypothetical protein
MDAAGRTKYLVFGLVGLLLLAVAGSMLYGVKKKRDLESSALASAADATARLQEAASGKADAARLQAHAQAVAQNLESLRREDLSRSKPLAEAAELYLTDVQALLRNHAAAARARAAMAASHRALTAHLAHASGRGTGWIQQAVTLKTRAERDSFDYRTAVGALATLYHTHRESQDKMRAVAPGVPLLEEARRQSLREQSLDAEKQAEAQIERIRTMALPR